jgi:hypothetical protein
MDSAGSHKERRHRGEQNVHPRATKLCCAACGIHCANTLVLVLLSNSRLKRSNVALRETHAAVVGLQRRLREPKRVRKHSFDNCVKTVTIYKLL